MHQRPAADFFITCAHGDLPWARRLRSCLASAGRVFLADDDLEPGALWDDVVPARLRAADVVVVLLSARTGKAWYAREEIAIAIRQARDGRQRVVPVFLDAVGVDVAGFGLRRLAGLSLDVEGSMEAVARRLAPMASGEAPMTSPEPRPETPIEPLQRLPPAAIDWLLERVIAHGIPRASLLVYVSADLQARMPSQSSAFDQHLSDVVLLDRLGRVDTQLPIGSWLRALKSRLGPGADGARVERLRVAREAGA